MKKTSLHKQRGVTLFGLIIILIILVCIGLLAAKIVPTVIEYNSIKKAIASVQAGGGSIPQMKTAFDRQADVGYISQITSNDLIFSKQNATNSLVVSFAYEKKIDLFGNVHLLIDYAGSAGDPTKD